MNVFFTLTPSQCRPSENSLAQLSVEDQLTFCYQLASGMSFLESKNVIHADLCACVHSLSVATKSNERCSRTVLVTDDRICKISDFGIERDVYAACLCRPISQTTELTQISDKTRKLPVRWMSPESLSTGAFTVKSDVWAYGVTCWEIMTLGATPFFESCPIHSVTFPCMTSIRSVGGAGSNAR